MSVISLSEKRQEKLEKDVYARWAKFYSEQTHEDLLEALVYEHENGFPLRRSPAAIDQLRHKALVDVLGDRAQTDFLRSFLEEIRAGGG